MFKLKDIFNSLIAHKCKCKDLKKKNLGVQKTTEMKENNIKVPKKGRKIPRIKLYSKTEYSDFYQKLEKQFYLIEEQTNKHNKEKKQMSEKESDKKNKNLSEDEINEYTYILIKNLEILEESSENLIEYLFDYENSDPKALNNLYNRLLGVLNITERGEKDKLQSYLLTLSALVNSDFSELKEKIFSFLEAINVYSDSQKELYEEKLYKKLSPYQEKIRTFLKEKDKTNECIITFDELRELLEKFDLKIKDSYIEYLIFLLKHKLAEDETRKIKIEYMNYLPLIDLLAKDVKETDNNDSSINEDDLLENIDTLAFNKMKKSAYIKDILPSKEEYGFNNYIPDLSQVKNVYNPADDEEEDNDLNKNIDEEALEQLNKEIDDEEKQLTKVSKGNKISESLKKSHSKLNDEFEISIKEFTKTNEKILEQIAEYMIKNKTSISKVFGNEKQTQAESFLKIIEEVLNLKLEINQQYCILLLLSEDDEDSISLQKLIDEMTNYGVFEQNVESVKNQHKQYTNKFFVNEENQKNKDIIHEKEESNYSLELKNIEDNED